MAKCCICGKEVRTTADGIEVAKQIIVSERALTIIRDAYFTLTLLEDERLNATAKVNLRKIRSWAILITDLVNKILSKSNEEG